mmetsp:Transcript_34301/g.90215  ORF Transcript_34301/g.90215 Transcript_34301/m.90215 type:complete len:663 (+) Transcript_34301:61-2049(+)
MSTKVVPIDIDPAQSEEEAAAIKLQAIQRGNNSRKEIKYQPGQVEERIMSSKNLGAKPLGAGGKKLSSWKLVKESTGIQFSNWDMALQVVDKTFYGEMAREVKRRVEDAKADPYGAYAKAFLIFISYWALYFCLRGDMAPPDDPELAKGFAIALIWICSTLGGKLMGKIGMPGLLGNLLSGVLLKNLIPYPGGTYDYDSAVCPPPPGCSASGSGSGSVSGRMLASGGIDYSNPQWCIGKSLNGLPNNWASDIITFGLSIIFMRGGLELDLELVKKAGSAAIRLTVMPGVCEALMVAVFSMMIFGMSFILGLSLGFILAAVSPAVVVGAMFELKKKGYGVKQNIPTLVVAAASMDDVVAISGFAICIAFAIPNKSATTVTTILNIAHGPLTLGCGMMLGLLGGNIAAMTQVWDTHWKRVAIVAIQGFLFAFGAKTLEREWIIDGAHPIGASTGILGALSMAGVTSYMWEHGKGHLSAGKEKHHAHDVEAALAKLWATVAQPLLFGVVGSYLDFRRMPGETIAKAILTVGIGVTFRTCMAYCAMFKAGLTQKEQLFVALSWLPKATVQAAFCSYPFDKIYEKDPSEWDSPEQMADYQQWGMDIMVTGGLAILMTAPIGLIIIQKLGPKWLECDSSRDMEKSIDDMVQQQLKEEEKKQGPGMPGA